MVSYICNHTGLGRIEHHPFGMVIEERSKLYQHYRFGFNGQEKDDEVSGDGNSMTAEFWQYISRIGRRWNVDPLEKFFLGSYVAFSNNPISRVDPRGDDDFFDKNGKYLGSVGNGSAIKVIDDVRCFEVINSAKISAEKKLGALKDHGATNFSQYDFSHSNLEVTSKILTHYYRKLYSTEQLHNAKISVAVNDRMLRKPGPLFTELTTIQYNDGVRGDAGTVAHTNFSDEDESYKISFIMLGSLSPKEGHSRLSAEVHTVNDLNILLRHEEYHGQNHEGVGVEGSDENVVNHLDAYHYSLTTDKDWSAASDQFKNFYRGAVVDYLNKIKDDATRENQVSRFNDYLTDSDKNSVKRSGN